MKTALTAALALLLAATSSLQATNVVTTIKFSKVGSAWGFTLTNSAVPNANDTFTLVYGSLKPFWSSGTTRVIPPGPQNEMFQTYTGTTGGGGAGGGGNNKGQGAVAGLNLDFTDVDTGDVTHYHINFPFLNGTFSFTGSHATGDWVYTGGTATPAPSPNPGTGCFIYGTPWQPAWQKPI